MIKLGDFVCQLHPDRTMILKRGIVVESLKESYVVHWLSFNKVFWMEFKGEVFAELNKRYLLTRMSYHRNNREVDIVVLSKAGKNGVGQA